MRSTNTKKSFRIHKNQEVKAIEISLAERLMNMSVEELNEEIGKAIRYGYGIR
jgi:hypothetical protein